MRDTTALRAARDTEPNPYARRFTAPKWTRLVTVTDVPALFARLPEFQGWTKDRHLDAAREYLIVAQAYRACWEDLIRRGERHYGTNGSLIAGGFREDWPEVLKDAIRLHAHGVSTFEERSAAHWQAGGRRIDTWRQARAHARETE